MESLSEIAEEIASHVAFETLAIPTLDGSPITSADAVAEAAGMQPIGDAWRELQASESPADLLAYFIGHDLAYRCRLVPNERRQHLAKALLAHTDPDATWLTNASSIEFCRDRSASYSWTPVSDWTFDVSLVAIGKTETLFFCFFAED